MMSRFLETISWLVHFHFLFYLFFYFYFFLFTLFSKAKVICTYVDDDSVGWIHSLGRIVGRQVLIELLTVLVPFDRVQAIFLQIVRAVEPDRLADRHDGRYPDADQAQRVCTSKMNGEINFGRLWNGHRLRRLAVQWRYAEVKRKEAKEKEGDVEGNYRCATTFSSR